MKKIFSEFLKLRRSVLGNYFCAKARIGMCLSGGKLEIGDGVKFSVNIDVSGYGNVRLGDQTILGFRAANYVGNGDIKIQARSKNAEVSVGVRTIVSGNLIIVANTSVVIGDDCLIGDMVSIMDSDFHCIDPDRRHEEGEISAVNIGNNVWLGARVMILKGVEIGKNTVVAAGSVVSKSLPSNVVAGGVPAKIIRPIGTQDHE